MDMEEIKKQIEEVLQEVKGIINKPLEHFSEKDYLRAKEIIENYKVTYLRIKEIEKYNNEKKSRIEEAKATQKNFPLVPMEDIEPQYEKLNQEIAEADSFLTSEEISEFVELYSELEKTILMYEKKREEEKIAEANRNLEEKTRKELLEKAEKVKAFVTEQGEPKCVEIIAAHPSINGPGYRAEAVEGYTSEKVAQLYEKFGICPECIDVKRVSHEEQEVDHYSAPYVTKWYSSIISFKRYDECDLKGKQGCKEAEKRLETIKNSEDRKYDKPGIVSLRISQGGISKDVRIEVTQRELAAAGILPEDLGWKRTRRNLPNLPKSIADADKEQGLTTTETGGIKGFFAELLNKFKGRGEK